MTQEAFFTEKQVAGQALVGRLLDYVRAILNLPPGTSLDPDVSLAEQTKLDSIEAFNAVATLHEIMGVEIPDDFDFGAMQTVRGLAEYVSTKYRTETVARIFTADFSHLSPDGF